MDDMEDDSTYSDNSYGGDREQGYDGSSNRQKLTARKDSYPRMINAFGDYEGEGDDNDNDDDDDDDVVVDDDDKEEDEGEKDDEDEEQLEDEDGGNNQSNGVKYAGKDVDNEDNEDEDTDEEDDEEDARKSDEDADLERHRKKRKMKSLASSYEFAPRVPPPPSATSVPKLYFSGRNPLTDWTENETFVLLDAWGDKFLQHGRKSLRADEWHEVAEEVSRVSKIERTDTQCRNRLDTLKKKYKKEKSNTVEAGGSSSSKWVYFKKMDMLLSTSAQQGGQSTGLDSSDPFLLKPKIHSNRTNGLEETRGGPDNTASANDKDDSDGLPPKKRKSGRDSSQRSSFRLLADSIQKFSNIYEKIEKKKRQQIQELEEIRMNFHRDLEMQRRQIMERTQAEIAKLRQDDGDENS